MWDYSFILKRIISKRFTIFSKIFEMKKSPPNVNSSKINEQTLFGKLLSLVERTLLVPSLLTWKNLIVFFGYNSVSITWLNRIWKKKKGSQRRYKNSPAFMTKATKDIKKNIGKKSMAWKGRMPSATKKVRNLNYKVKGLLFKGCG